MKILSTRRLGLFLCVASLVGTGVPAKSFAQDDPPAASEQSDAQKAQAHFAKGAEYFYQKEYAQAVVEFLNAYKYKPDPMILYNLSMAHARLGNIEEAAKAAARARQMGGMPAQAALKNDARLRGWQQVLAARGVAKVMEGIARSEYMAEGERHQEITPPPATEDALLSTMGWTGVGVGIVGLGLLGYATYADLSMQDDLDAYKAAGRNANQAEYQQLKEDLDSRQTAGLIALYSGVGLTALGIGLLTFDLMDTDTQTASAGVTTDGQSATVQISYRFR